MITINVDGQKMSLYEPSRIVSGSRNFVEFQFVLSADWDGMTEVYAQFLQGKNSHNRALNEERKCYLPTGIVDGVFTVMLFGVGAEVTATTNHISFSVRKSKFISDAASTDIEPTMYEQLVKRFEDAITNRGEFAIDAHNIPFAHELFKATDVHNAIVESKTDPDGSSKCINITHDELVRLRDNGDLVAGRQYRITDYMFTTSQPETQSAENSFDIIVEATSTDILNENAKAIRHDGDTHFALANLNAWKLKYSIDNDKRKYAWADEENGKGIIYYMKDEFDNECHYDFKNALFERSAEWFANHEDWCITNLGEVPSESKYYYTFTWVDENGAIQDLSVIGNTLLNDEQKISGVFGNSVGQCSEYSIYLEVTSIFALPKNVLLSSYNYDSGLFYACHNNTFGTDCSSNTFGTDCSSNTFGTDCSSNTFGTGCYSNTFGTGCYSNSFGNGCYSNSFGNSCSSNSFGNSCSSNSFGNSCSSNTFGTDCYSNTFGTDCYSNTFGNSKKHLSLGSLIGSGRYSNKLDFSTQTALEKLGHRVEVKSDEVYVWYDITTTNSSTLSQTVTRHIKKLDSGDWSSYVMETGASESDVNAMTQAVNDILAAVIGG